MRITVVQKHEKNNTNKTNYNKLQLVAPDHDIDNAESIDLDDVVNEEKYLTSNY